MLADGPGESVTIVPDIRPGGEDYTPAMRRLVVPTLLVVLLAACGSSNSGAPSAAVPTAPTIGAPSAPPADTAAPAGKGSVDCTAIKTAAQQLLAIQLLGQLKDADGIEAIKTKQFGNLDVDQFLAAMHELHALDSYTSALGDPKAAIDTYEKAGQAAKVLFATEPVSQAAIDTYNQGIGPLSEFLGHQIAISGALDAAGC